MAYEVKIPSLGESVSEAVLGRWLKKDGDEVVVDEALLELESDKANMELAAEYTGKLKILRAAGETVHFGDVVAVIEDLAGAATGRDGGATGPTAVPAAARGGGPTGPTAIPAAASAAAATVPAPPPAQTTAVVPAPAASAGERPLSPAVRRIAGESEIDVSGLAGTGPGGRITKADALAAAAERSAATAPVQRATVTALHAAPAGGGRPLAEPGGEERVPMSRLRQVIARRMVESRQTTATLTTFNEVDMSAILELRARYREAFQKQHGVGLGFMSFFVAACCAATRDVPEANARLEGTDVVYHHYVNMGVAVGTERGLVVPVVRGADRLSLAEIEREIGRLAGLARDGKLAPDDLAGATFTISNGGIYGSLLSTPILNPPQSAILGMHKIEKRPVVIDDQVVIRPMMYLALSYDHRLIDGKGAVTFLVRAKERLEDPTRLLVGL